MPSRLKVNSTSSGAGTAGDVHSENGLAGGIGVTSVAGTD